MNASLLAKIDALSQATVTELRACYQELFGESSRSFHRQFLFRRIAWRLQAIAEGDLSERARQRALAIANDTDLRIRAPLDYTPGQAAGVRKATARSTRTRRDPRLPQPGTLLTRQFGGQLITVHVLDRGFECRGRRYNSLSAIAIEVTGTRWNGYVFFGLNGAKNDAKQK